MRSILVSGASGIVGYGVLKSIRKTNADYRLIGTTIYDDSIATAFCDIFEKAPKTADETYIDWLCSVIKKYQVDMIIPGIEADMKAWNDAKVVLEGTGACVLLNNPELVRLCSDKWLFYQKLRQADSQAAIESRLDGTFEALCTSFGLPFLLKPRQGYASRGIVRVDTEAEFNQHASELGSTLMAQPIIGTDEEEYTVSAFFSKESVLIAHMGLKRKLSKEGFTEKAWVAEPSGVEATIKELAALLKPVGPTNFQFRLDDGKLKLLEINPRISSATSIRAAFGYNESSMSIDYFLDGRAPVQPEIRQGYAIRYTEDYIFYDSDTI